MHPAPPGPDASDTRELASVHRHDGFFFRQSLGVAWLRSRGRSEPSGVQPLGDPAGPTQPVRNRMHAVSGGGVAASVALGGSPTPGLALAFELTSHMFWELDVETENQAVQTPFFFDSTRNEAKYLSYGLLAVWYPDSGRGFNAALSAALASAHQNGPTGWLAAPQLGYEWWIAEQWSVGAVLRGSFGYLSSGDESEFFFSRFVGGGSGYVAMPSLSCVVTYH
jgi:hypothetical protein